MRINEDFLDNIDATQDVIRDDIHEEDGHKDPTPADFRVCLNIGFQFDGHEKPVPNKDILMCHRLVSVILDRAPFIRERSRIVVNEYTCTGDFYDRMIAGDNVHLYMPELTVAFNGNTNSVLQSMRFLHAIYNAVLKGLRYQIQPKLFIALDAGSNDDEFNFDSMRYSWMIHDRDQFTTMQLAEGKSPKQSVINQFKEAWHSAVVLSAFLTDFKQNVFDEVERIYKGRYSIRPQLESTRKSLLGIPYNSFSYEIELPDELKKKFEETTVNNELFRNIPVKKMGGFYKVIEEEYLTDYENEAYVGAKNEFLDNKKKYHSIRFITNGETTVMLMQTPAVRVWLDDNGAEYVIVLYSKKMNDGYSDVDRQLLKLLIDGFTSDDYNTLLEVIKKQT